MHVCGYCSVVRVPIIEVGKGEPDLCVGGVVRVVSRAQESVWCVCVECFVCVDCMYVCQE